jgi:alkyldihydroxyacetonephosphate synthase
MGVGKDFQPDWTETPPAPGTFRSIFKWGAPDKFKHPNARLFSMLKDRLEMTDADFSRRASEGNTQITLKQPVGLSERHIDQLKKIVGEENVNSDDFSRAKYSSGRTAEESFLFRNGVLPDVSDLAVHPRDKQDVQAIVDCCNEHRIPLHVYGGGSSVTLGLTPAKGGITLVMTTHMNRILDFSETNQTITVEPGIMGPDYEDALNRAPERFRAEKRYTCGHFPQSFEYSSVGGWVVTLGSGQKSSYYGDMYDIVLSQEYVTPAGTFQTLDFPATATGPKVNDIMKGSEGAFGILVSATLKVFRYLPENRRRFAFMFPTWKAAVDAAREISQGEFGMPAVFRISDPEETDIGLKLYGIDHPLFNRTLEILGLKPMQRCLCIGCTEGEKDFSKNVWRKIKRIARKHGARYLSGYPVKKWEHGRYTDPYMRDDLNDFGIMIDTLESGVMWDRLHDLYKSARSYIKDRPNTICMIHASHLYPQGTNLYFIFIRRMCDIEEYRDFQRGIIDMIEKHGGSLSHHHGVGKMMGPWMERHLGKEQMEVLRALKRHFDPNNIMNPGGTLGLDPS